MLTGSGAAPNLNGLFPANATISGVMVGPRSFLSHVGRFIEKRAIAPVIDRTFPCDEAPEAYRHLEGVGHMGRVVVAL